MGLTRCEPTLHRFRSTDHSRTGRSPLKTDIPLRLGVRQLGANNGSQHAKHYAAAKAHATKALMDASFGWLLRCTM
jgi:hypothetical protein